MMKKALSALIVLAMTTGLLAACGTRNEGAGNTEGTTRATTTAQEVKEKEVLKIKRIARGVITDTVQSPTVFEVKIKEQFKIDFETTVYPEQDYDQKVILQFTAGELPEYLDFVNGYPGLSMEKLALEGYLISWDDKLDKVPEFQKRFFNQEDFEFTLKDAAVDGKLYYLPWNNYRVNPYGWVYKKGYFESKGIAFPKTIDEYLDVLAKVKADHPEWAIPGRTSYGGLQRPTMGIFSAYRTSTTWYIDPEEGNKLLYGPVTNKYRELLKTARFMYKQGYIHKESETMSDQQYNTWIQQRMFAMMYTAVNQINDNKPDTPEIDKWYYTDTYIGTNDGKPGLWAKESPYFKYGPAVVTQTSPEKQERLFEMINWLNSKEGINYWWMGEEGKTYQLVDGKPRFIGDYKKDDTGLDPSDKFTSDGYKLAPMNGYSVDFLNRNNIDPIIEMTGKLQGKDNYFPVLSIKYTETEMKDLADIRTLVEDTVKQYFVKFIMDDKLDPANDSDWQAYMDTLVKNGYDTYEKTTQEAYGRSVK